MSKADVIELEGIVTEKLPNTLFWRCLPMISPRAGLSGEINKIITKYQGRQRLR